jgi:hypothetical protein
MVVRISWTRRDSGRASLQVQNAALALASLLAPAALIAFTLTLWSLGAELHLTARFFVARGLLSHWQVWLAAAAGLSFCAWLLNRYARAIDQDYAN